MYDMGARTVRLDAASERLLREIQRATGDTVSGALKRGLEAAAKRLREQPGPRAFEVFSKLDLGPGGYAKASARRAKAAIRDVIARRAR